MLVKVFVILHASLWSECGAVLFLLASYGVRSTEYLANNLGPHRSFFFAVGPESESSLQSRGPPALFIPIRTLPIFTRFPRKGGEQQEKGTVRDGKYRTQINANQRG